MSGHSFGASYSTWGIAEASYDGVDSVCQEGIGLEDSNVVVYRNGVCSIVFR